MRSKEK
jgi:uncharacterized protein with GYD domain